MAKETTYWKIIQQPFPKGWEPVRGELVVVPSVKGRGSGYAAVVEKIAGDIVTVKTYQFRLGRQQFLLSDIRPNPHWDGAPLLNLVGGPNTSGPSPNKPAPSEPAENHTMKASTP